MPLQERRDPPRGRAGGARAGRDARGRRARGHAREARRRARPTFIARPAASVADAAGPGERLPGFFEGIDFEQRRRRRRSGRGRRAPCMRSYVQPSRHHNPMEPSATLARWDGDTLTVFDATQRSTACSIVLAAVLRAGRREQIRVRSPHTGGGFGGKGFVWPHQILAAAAARVVRRPVKHRAHPGPDVRATSAISPSSCRPIALGVDADGRLTALDHDVGQRHGSVGRLRRVRPPRRRRTTYASPAIHLTPARPAREREPAQPDARARRGPRHLGAGAARSTSWPHRLGDRPARAQACQLRRQPPGERSAVVVQEAARGYAEGARLVRLAGAAARAAARRRLAGGHGMATARWAASASRRRCGSGSRPTAPR